MMGPTDSKQQRLVNECQGLVRFLAQQIHTRLPSRIDLDDLIGYGQLGLMQAAQDYDPDKGVKFSTFAYYRIRGAIYDGARKLEWYRSSRDPDAKYEQLADEVAETCTSEASTGDAGQEATWFARTASSLAMVFLNSHSESGEVEDRSVPAPWANLLERETSLKLREALDRIAPDAAALIRSIYYEDRTLQEAADRLSISKSWASRLHAKALEQLSRALRQIDPAIS
jgi:RNA polymerase sigma factor for flagellar operon FliA